MKCPACGKEIDPLTLFDGRWGCGSCHKIITNPKFKITKENVECVNLSKLYYSRALELTRLNVGEFKTKKKEYDYYIAQANKYALEGIRLDNPEAYMMMGFFYDYDYCSLELQEVVRCKMATPYYLAVIQSEFSNDKIEVELEGDAYTKADFTLLQEKTAHLFADMLDSLGYDDRISYGIELIRQYNSLLSEKYKLRINVNADENSSNVENLISSMVKEKENSPIYAGFVLDEDSVLGLENLSNNTFNQIKQNRNLYIFAYQIDENDQISGDVRTTLKGDIKEKLGFKKGKASSLFESHNKIMLTIFYDKNIARKKTYRSLIEKNHRNKDDVLVKTYNQYLSDTSVEKRNDIEKNFIFYEDDFKFANDLDRLFGVMLKKI